MKEVRVAQIRAMLKEILATSGGDLDKVNAVVAIQLDYALRLNNFSSLGELEELVQALKDSNLTPDVAYAGKLRERLQELGQNSVTFTEPEWEKFENLYQQQVLTPLFA